MSQEIFDLLDGAGEPRGAYYVIARRRVAAIAVFRTTVLIRVCCRPNETRASCAVYAGVQPAWGRESISQMTDFFCVVTKITAEYYRSVS